MSIVFVDLMIDNGELVRIECPGKFEDDLHDAIGNAMKRGDWFSVSRFDGCTAEYLGVYIERISMRRVVGVL